MIFHASAALAAQHKFRVDSHGAGAWIHPYLGVKPGAQRPHPMVYLVEQDPSTTIPTHFHQVPQFQVVLAGQGQIGRHDLQPGVVHYANAFTGYGPLCAGAAGLSYLTIRSDWDPGLRPLPESRHELDAVSDRVALNLVTAPLERGQSLEAQERLALLDHPCGVKASLIKLSAGQSLNLRHEALVDRALVVFKAWIILNRNIVLATNACAFVSKGEAVVIEAREESVEVLMLSFA
jgi:hypothetical protein